ncbi:TonB-dependent receptor [Steroidobacter sp.]|uniref:TonB-dependent receptor n=1 Tax=Steroidobacter sp. TaxID=1978227 RepID=UPI001A5BF6F4|nr:TonB-dependent receptor [Steroidobacter sp.]MBL8270292.1 TonB-dependent receptor [Steroidobacter sp.]
MRRVSAAAFVTLLSAHSISTLHAQEVDANGAGTDAGVIDSVVVLGTARENTTALTSTAPVDVITPEQLRETGAVTVNQALSKLHPSFNFPQGQNAVKGQGVRSASLRGVGPAYTLVLVNGKRRHLSAQLSGTDPWPAAQVVDINTIPVNAIERVEVLRDGAAAQYGSDAIAGVINIVLRKDSSGGELSGRYGGYSDGGGDTYQLLGNAATSLGEDGFVNVSIDRLKNDNVDRSEADWRQLFPTGDSRNQTYDKKYGQWGQSDRDNWTALVNAELGLSDNVRAYGWANYSDKSAMNYVNPERIVKANTSSPTATNPNRVSENAVIPIYPNGYQPNMTYKAEDIAAVAGVRFDSDTLGNLDVGVSFGQNETGRYTDNTINPSYGVNSPTSFYLGSWKSRTTSVTADYTKDLELPGLQSTVLSSGVLYRHEYWGTADLGDAAGYTSGPLAGQSVASLYLPGGIYAQYASLFPNANFATDTASGVIAATGSSTSGIQPIDAGSVTRNVYGGYAGLDFTVFDKLDLGLTARFEDYSDFGNTTNYRLTGRYEFIPEVALRGTVSTGFHAPSLAQLGQQSTGYTSTFTNNGSSILTPGRTRLFRSNDPQAAAFGAKALDPEESTTFSLGVVLRPTSSSSVTIDAYQLDVDDVITITDTIQGPNVTAAFNAIGLAGYTQATYYVNAWDSRTRGIDLVGRQQFNFSASTLDITAAASFLDTEVTKLNPLTNIGTSAVIGASRIRDAETGIPENKYILNGRYSLGAWSVDLTGTYYDSYTYNVGTVPGVATANGNIDQEFSPETYIDLGFDYEFSAGLRLNLLVQNVFNKYPDKYVNGNRSSGINPYSFIAPNGASGRFIQGGVTFTF